MCHPSGSWSQRALSFTYYSMSTVLIGADICPIEGNRACFQAGDASSLFHDLLPELAAADLVIANLECPLIESPSPIAKTGPTFGESGECIRGIKAAGIHLLCLANNHIMDHGPAGLKNTLEVCSRAGIATVGGGMDLQSAARLHVVTLGRVRVAVLAMAEHEFSIAKRTSAGANPLDVIQFVRTVRNQRNEFDYLIVLVHGSHEFHAPTPRLQKTCRFLVELGANAVVVQHPHALGGYEEYQGGHIVYGQGALLMDEAIYRSRKSFHDGFLVKLMIGEDARSTMDLVPFVQSDPVPGARRLAPEAAMTFRESLAARSKLLKDELWVADQWLQFCRENRYAYFGSLLRRGRIFRTLDRGGILTRLLHRKRGMLGIQNLIRCETHREALETIFGDEE